MKVTGTHELSAPPERVWETLADHEALGAALPGCEDAAPGPPLELMTAWRVAALDGRYRVRVGVVEADPPAAVTLRLAADGEPGRIDATVQAELTDRDGRSELTWTADCDSGGQLTTVGGHVLAAALQRAAQDLFAGVEDELLTGALGGAPAADALQAPAAPSREWGPLEGGPRPDTTRLIVAGLAGALCAVLLVWLVSRLRGRS